MSQLSPAEPAIPATAPPPDSPLPGTKAAASKPPRHDDLAGPALALRNWRVPWRLIALIVLPTVMGMVFAGLRVDVAASSAATFGRVEQLAVLGQQITGLAQAMEDERDLTAAFIADGRPAAGVAGPAEAVCGHRRLGREDSRAGAGSRLSLPCPDANQRRCRAGQDRRPA